jgi:hypothetical protein
MLVQAWFFPMLVRRDLIPLFSLYALLYAAPLLHDGFDTGEHAFVMWMIGFFHITVMRVLVAGT